jgi:hypothetical protein
MAEESLGAWECAEIGVEGSVLLIDDKNVLHFLMDQVCQSGLWEPGFAIRSDVIPFYQFLVGPYFILSQE